MDDLSAGGKLNLSIASASLASLTTHSCHSPWALPRHRKKERQVSVSNHTVLTCCGTGSGLGVLTDWDTGSADRLWQREWTGSVDRLWHWQWTGIADRLTLGVLTDWDTRSVDRLWHWQWTGSADRLTLGVLTDCDTGSGLGVLTDCDTGSANRLWHWEWTRAERLVYSQETLHNKYRCKLTGNERRLSHNSVIRQFTTRTWILGSDSDQRALHQSTQHRNHGDQTGSFCGRKGAYWAI